MKVLLEVKDDKAQAFMEMLTGLPYVKARQLDAIHFRLLDEAIEIVDNVHLIEQGKLETRDANEFLNEIFSQNDPKV